VSYEFAANLLDLVLAVGVSFAILWA